MRSVAVVGLLVLGGCATPHRDEPPKLSHTVDDVGEPGSDCGARIVAVRGSRPGETRVVARVTVTADRPVPLEALEQAALVPALRRCATGLSILRAEASDGTDGYTAVTAEAWDAAASPAASSPVP